jgi:hypothetical protein
VNDEIQREADTITLEPFQNAQLLLMGLRAGNVVGGFLARTLEAELKMIEACLHQRPELGLVQRQAGSDEANVESGTACIPDEFCDVWTRKRFAAGEINLENTGFASSTVRMIDLVRNAVEAMGLDLASAVRRASLIPATIAGVADRKGSLEPGKDADIVLLETKPRLEVRMTLSKGEVLHDAHR